MNSLHHISDVCQAGQSWTIHRNHLQKQPRSCIPYLRTHPLNSRLIVACILKELRNINTNQPTNVKFHDGSFSITDDPIIIPAEPGTGMINLRKFRSMYDLLGDSLDVIQSPYSYWYRLFPEDLQFPTLPKVDEGYLVRWERIRNLVEMEIEECWDGGNGNWERGLHIKKILASAGF